MSRLVIVLILVLFSGESIASRCDDLPVLTTERRDGTKVGLFIANDQFANAPDWSPDSGDPPLSFSEAHRLAMEWAKTTYSKYDEVSVREISLTNRFCSSTDKRWYYIFDFTLVFDGNVFLGSGNWTAVLMNGTVIGPRKIE